MYMLNQYVIYNNKHDLEKQYMKAVSILLI